MHVLQPQLIKEKIMNANSIQEKPANTQRKSTIGFVLGAIAVNVLTFGLMHPAYSANVSNGNLNCRTQANRTAATATCSGKGVWRLRIDCKAEPDFVSEWVGQNGGTIQKRGECRFRARGATVEFN